MSWARSIPSLSHFYQPSGLVVLGSIQRVNRWQLRGDIWPPSKHFSKSSQTIQGQSLMESIVMGFLRENSRYVHLPLCSTFLRLTLPFSSNFIPILEPSLLVEPNFFHMSLWSSPSGPTSKTIWRAFRSKSFLLSNSPSHPKSNCDFIAHARAQWV